jgi:ATP-dependent DNA helicase PIF1
MKGSIELGIGCRVMLRRNINVSIGLVNGSLGTVTGFKWSALRREPLSEGELPEQVLVEFDDPEIAAKYPNAVGKSIPISPITVSFQGKKGKIINRKMIPLILSWAVTIHKMQGVTLEKAVVELNCFGHAMEYVALSRVKSLEGLAISYINLKRFERNNFTSEEALEEINRQLSLKSNQKDYNSTEKANKLIENKKKTKELIEKIKETKKSKAHKPKKNKKSSPSKKTPEKPPENHKIPPTPVEDKRRADREREEIEERENQELVAILRFIEQVRTLDDFIYPTNKPHNNYFDRVLVKNGLINRGRVVYANDDGNCFYNSLSLLYFGNEDRQALFRKGCILIINQNRAYFEELLSRDNRDFDTYVAQHSRDLFLANEIIILAASMLCNRPLFSYSSDGQASFYVDLETRNKTPLPILLYNSHFSPFFPNPGQVLSHQHRRSFFELVEDFIFD